MMLQGKNEFYFNTYAAAAESLKIVVKPPSSADWVLQEFAAQDQRARLVAKGQLLHQVQHSHHKPWRATAIRSLGEVKCKASGATAGRRGHT